MVVSRTQVVVRIAAAGIALGLVVAGCSKDDSSTEASAPSSAAATATSAPSSAAATSAAGEAPGVPVDYRSLLITPEAIPEGVGVFIADPPQLNPNGVAGAAQLLHTAENTALIGDTVLLTESAAKAEAALEKSKEGIGASVTGTPTPMPSISPNAVVAAGTSPDGSKAVTLLLFSEQNALVSLEFDSAPGDLNPVPIDFVEQVGLAQQQAIKTGLPNFG